MFMKLNKREFKYPFVVKLHRAVNFNDSLLYFQVSNHRLPVHQHRNDKTLRLTPLSPRRRELLPVTTTPSSLTTPLLIITTLTVIRP